MKATITDEILDINENAENLIETSEKQSDYYIETTEQNILDYIEKGTNDYTLQTKNTRATEKYIPGQQQINNMDSGSEMSHCAPGGTGGICGFVATASVLAWYDTYKNGAFVDNTTYFNKARGYNVYAGSPGDYANSGRNYKQTFSYNLWCWHSPSKGQNGGYSTAFSIKDTLNSYLASRNLGLYFPIAQLFPSTNSIKSIIDNTKVPYIIFGDVKKENENSNKVWHAVTIYGYNGNRLIAHMGWPGYDNVYISGSWISGLYLL